MSRVGLHFDKLSDRWWWLSGTGGGGSRGPVTFWFVDIFRSLSLSKGGVRRVGLHFDKLSDRWWWLSGRRWSGQVWQWGHQ
ncbi:hypothetical protein PLANTIT3_60266 [Plantibacter sp. T3]|nr:hypothetical protein PLANTIT3_60266 [Plantibacter sp. T3]